MEHKVFDVNSPYPLYRQVADWMRENINAQQWKKNQQLPAEEDLAKQLEVSRGTLRKAISLLIKEGLLIQIQGKGTFVAAPKVAHPFGQELISFAESMEREGIDYETKVIKQEVTVPLLSIRQKLEIAPNENVLYLKRIRYIKDEPVILLENFINLTLCKGIEHSDFEKNTLFSQIEKFSNSKIRHGIRRFEARALTEEQANLLNLDVDMPVLYLEQITFDQEKRPLETSRVWLRSDKYVITSVLTR